MKKVKGFTILELLVLLTVVAILASTAAPTYRDLMVKKRVEDHITSVIDNYKNRMETLLKQYRTNVCILDRLGAFSQNTYVESARAFFTRDGSNVIQVTASLSALGITGNSNAGPLVLEIRARGNGLEQPLTWTCHSTPAYSEFVPDICKTPGGLTDVSAATAVDLLNNARSNSCPGFCYQGNFDSSTGFIWVGPTALVNIVECRNSDSYNVSRSIDYVLGQTMGSVYYGYTKWQRCSIEDGCQTEAYCAQGICDVAGAEGEHINFPAEIGNCYARPVLSNEFKKVGLMSRDLCFNYTIATSKVEMRWERCLGPNSCAG